MRAVIKENNQNVDCFSMLVMLTKLCMFHLAYFSQSCFPDGQTVSTDSHWRVETSEQMWYEHNSDCVITISVSIMIFTPINMVRNSSNNPLNVHEKKFCVGHYYKNAQSFARILIHDAILFMNTSTMLGTTKVIRVFHKKEIGQIHQI